MRLRRAVISVVLVGLAATTVAAQPASAASKAARFVGNCSLVGTDTFSPTLTITGAAGSATAVAAGHCSGLLTSIAGTRAVRGAPASYRALATSDSLSCVGGIGTGSGTLMIAGTVIGFRLSEPQLTVLSALHLSGTGGGSATGIASVVSADPSVLLTACLTAGIATVPIAIALLSTGISS